jgi:hypothetical protein
VSCEIRQRAPIPGVRVLGGRPRIGNDRSCTLIWAAMCPDRRFLNITAWVILESTEISVCTITLRHLFVSPSHAPSMTGPVQRCLTVRAEFGCADDARYLRSQFGGFTLGGSAQLKLSPTRRIELGSTVFGFTSLLKSGKCSRI